MTTWYMTTCYDYKSMVWCGRKDWISQIILQNAHMFCICIFPTLKFANLAFPNIHSTFAVYTCTKCLKSIFASIYEIKRRRQTSEMDLNFGNKGRLQSLWYTFSFRLWGWSAEMRLIVLCPNPTYFAMQDCWCCSTQVHCCQSWCKRQKG